MSLKDVLKKIGFPLRTKEQDDKDWQWATEEEVAERLNKEYGEPRPS